ncbi:MAG: hypothetical protein PHZ27_06250 [Candidatus Omnitrophica bacterium]|nr:hypothetical protein [Candidatus Omnitrophota bacterium]
MKKYGNILGIFLASLFGSIYLLPDFLSASAFFIAGLGIGYVYSKTNDIYGASLAGFLIRLALVIA